MAKYDRPLVNGMDLYEYFNSRPESFYRAENPTNGLVSVKYMHMGVDWTLPYMLQARGLVINHYGEIIARPYDKFFNYNQLTNIPFIDDSIKPLSDWEDDEFVVLDKVDGSLAIFYTYNNQLMIASSGQTFGLMQELFSDTLSLYPLQTKHRLEEVCKEWTLMMEYVDPMHQIVLEYPERKFLLHGARNTLTGEDMPLEDLQKLATYVGIDMVDIIPNITTLDDLLNNLHLLKHKEGFVVWFKSGKRLKFKTEEYLELHSMMDNYAIKPYSKRKIKQIAGLAFDDSLDDVIAEYADKEYGKLAMKAFNDVLKEYKEFYDRFVFSKNFVVSNIEDYKKNKREVSNTVKQFDKKIQSMILGMFTQYFGHVTLIKNATKQKDYILNNRDAIYKLVENGGEADVRLYKYYDVKNHVEKPLMVEDRSGNTIQVFRPFVQKYSTKKLKQLKEYLNFAHEDDFKVLSPEEFIQIELYEATFLRQTVDKLAWTGADYERFRIKAVLKRLEPMREHSTKQWRWK